MWRRVGKALETWRALYPKSYAFKTTENKKVRKTKWISKVVVKKEIKHEGYKHVLDTGDCINKDVYAIRSLEHKVYTIKTNKTCLTPWYDKMKVVDNINCIPFGYKRNKI